MVYLTIVELVFGLAFCGFILYVFYEIYFAFVQAWNDTREFEDYTNLPDEISE